MQSKVNLIPHLILASIVFIIFIIIGTRLPPDVQLDLVTQLQASLSPLASMGVVSLILLIFFNNAIKCFLIIAMGVLLGLPSVIFLCFNAIAVGILASYLGSEVGLDVIIAGLAPHGIIEIPLMILSVASGFSLGSEALKSITKQKNELKAQYIYSLKFYSKWMLALFLVAAMVEVFITPHIVALAGGNTGLMIP